MTLWLTFCHFSLGASGIENTQLIIDQ